MSLGSIYVSRKNMDTILELERLAIAKGISKNEMFMFILKDWLENNKCYIDRKITDFEVQEVERIIDETPVYCKECFSKDTDNDGFVVHDYACSFSLPYSNKDDKENK